MSMSIDLRKLEEYDQMAVNGAAGASDRLSGLTGVETTVRYSRLHVASSEEVHERFERDDTVAITISLEGLLNGEAVAVFDRQSAAALAEAFIPMLESIDGYTDKHESAVEEICNVMVSGYVDGWANLQGEAIRMSPPMVTTSAVNGNDVKGNIDLEFIDDASSVISQWSSITTPDREITFQMFLLLHEASTKTLYGGDAESVSVDDATLGKIKEVVDAGALTTVDRLSDAGGKGASFGSTTLEIVPTERFSESISDEQGIGAVIELPETPRGYIVVLFETDSTLLESLEGSDLTPPEAVVGSLETAREEAVAAVGSRVAAELAEGLTSEFETPVEISPVKVVEDMRSSILNDAVVNLGPVERFVLNFEAQLEADGECTVYTLIRPVDIPTGWYGNE